MSYTNTEVNKIDRETHKLSELYSEARIKVGMNLAEKLYSIESNKLYLKINEVAYPNFNAYIASLGMDYHAVRELISTYQCFVLAGGYDIEFLSKINHYKLMTIKPELFKKKNGKYEMIKSKIEANKWISSAKSDISVNDLKQLRRETKIGEHEHEWEPRVYKQCIHCGLRVK